MTDYDRGAYTPQTDAPLAFDPRRTSERRPMPMALIGSAAVLVILLAGVAMVYRGGVRHAGESPRPVGEPVMAVKTAPTPAPAAAPANMDVYAEGHGAATPAATPTASASGPASTTPTASTMAGSPTFAAPPEQPAARPAPKPATVAMLSKPTAPSHIERRPTPDEAAVEATSRPQPAAKTASAKPAIRSKLDEAELAAAGGTRIAEADATPPAHKLKAAASAPDEATPVKPAATSAVAAPTLGKSAVVQIGAFSSTALADRGYADVSAAMSERMGGKSKHVQPLDKDGTTLYRTWLSGFASRADAQAFCEALKAKGKTCLVKG